MMDDNKMKMSLYTNADNGTGKVIVDSKSPIGPDVSKKLGYNMIHILEGEYNIDYSNNQYGDIIYNIEKH